MKLRLILVFLPLAAAAAGCAVAPQGRGLQVVAAESSWGSIAAQLGGARVHVTSVVASPATDPHDYEPTAADARAVAEARLVVVNGIGYDPWASQLVAANPLPGRVVVDVGAVTGVHAGGNPHRWYSPADVARVIAAVSAGYARLDPGGAAAYRRLRTAFETFGLRRYHDLLASIRRRDGGLPVGASESVFAPLAQALGLRLLTPATFLNAISEGAEPAPADITAIGRQIAAHRIRTWVVNTQNETPDVQRLTAAARAHGIPVVELTETPSPAGVSFQAWQVRELEALAAALGR